MFTATTSRRLGARRAVTDRLVGVFALLPTVTSDRRLLVESAMQGWWYSAPALKRERLVVYLSDPDLLPRNRRALDRFWTLGLQNTVSVRRTVQANATGVNTRTINAGTFILRSVCGADWLAVGDAAFSFDPLSGNGVFRAFMLAEAAARTVDMRLSGATTTLERYQSFVESVFKQHLELRRHFYQREHRWSNSMFWFRR